MVKIVKNTRNQNWLQKNSNFLTKQKILRILLTLVDQMNQFTIKTPIIEKQHIFKSVIPKSLRIKLGFCLLLPQLVGFLFHSLAKM